MKNRRYIKKIIAILLCLGLTGISYTVQPVSGADAEYMQSILAQEQPDFSQEEEDQPQEDDFQEEEPEEEEPGEEEPEEEEPEEEAPEEEEPKEEGSDEEEPDEEDQLDLNEQQDGFLPEQWNIINEYTVEVSTYDALVQALGDVHYTHIYFTDNIIATTALTMEQRAIIHPDKSKQYIYGHAYGGSEIFTFTQSESKGIHQPILVLTGSAVSLVTVADINIVGRNPHGMVYVDALAGVVTRYENVAYTGPQLAYNAGGTVQFDNVDITLTQGYETSYGRAAEAFNIEFEGRNTITTAHTYTGHPTFTMTRINTEGGRFLVQPDADVHITTPSVLFHTAGPENKSPVLIFEEGSSFYAECGQGFILQYVNAVHIAKYATVKLVQSAATSDGYALTIRDELTVDEGAVFELLRPKGGTAAIQLHNSGGSIRFNNPERVFIYANSGLLFGCVGNTTIHINTDALNLWTSAPGGSPDGKPTRIWNKWGKDQPLSVDVFWSGTNVMGSVTSNLDLEKDPVTEDITTASFGLRSSQLLVLGSMTLAVDELAPGDTIVTGFTEPEALLTGSYTTAANTAGLIGSGMADAKGNYRLSLNDGMPLENSRVYVTAYKNGLRIRQYPYEIEGEQVLAFVSLPDIRFESAPIPIDPGYVKRIDPNWTITVLDTRKNSPGFKIQASIQKPLTATQGNYTYTIPNGLGYVNSMESYMPLSVEPITIYSDGGGMTGERNICWEDTQGLLLRISPDMVLYPGIEYSTSINWLLVAAP